MDETDRLWVDSMPQAYERWLASAVFRPFAVDLARRVASRGATNVLELAAGTGVLTRELVDIVPSGQVTATDLNPAMVDFGRRRVPAAAWQQADAVDLPFEDGQFDLVACQFGVMFFSDRKAAFSEARRVLTTDGTVLLSTWAALETHDFQAALVAGLERAFPRDPPMFMATVPHGCADIEPVLAELRAARLDCVAAETVTLEGHAASAEALALGYCTGTPLRAGIEARGDLMEVIDCVAKEMEARLGAGPVTGRMTAYVIEAVPAG